MRRGARPDRDGDARDLPLMELALPGVDSGSDLQPKLGDRRVNGMRAADSTRGAVEGGEEAVSRSVPLLAPESGELAPDDGVVCLQKVPPGAVAEFSGALCGADDVREEHGRQHRFRDERHLLAGDEPRDLRRDLRGEKDPPVVVSRDSDCSRAGDRAGDGAPGLSMPGR